MTEILGVMSQEDIDRLRAGIERMNRTGEIDADAFAPDFELRQASSVIYEDRAEALEAVGL